MTEPQGTSEARADPVEATRTFVDAVIWGEHHTVWELLGAEGRNTVLRVAVNSGMEEALADRLREGTATGPELNEFLIDLVNGLRADLHGADLDALEYELDTEEMGPGSARVRLTAPVPAELGSGLPVATAELTQDGAQWRVDRLIPVRSVTG